MRSESPLPRLIAWEVTRSCMLACRHCRAAAQPRPYPDELTTRECYRLLDNIASFAQPIIILTGGEPMLREDIYDIAAHATGLGLRVVMAPCGALIDDASAARIVESGIRHISISLDGATAEGHDAFRGVSGAFASAVRGIEAAKRAGLEFQVNTTITRHNLAELPAILELAVRLGAKVFNPFLLVPTGRGRRLADQEISPRQYEEALIWLAGQQGRSDIGIRVTCAPHYQRVIRQAGASRPGPHAAKGCMGGQGFAFISHRGKAQICGFLDIECGDVRKEDFDFRRIWETSEVFLMLRDVRNYHGRCGRCEFARVCGGCRARAYAVSGDYLGEEPFCLHQPKGIADCGLRIADSRAGESVCNSESAIRNPQSAMDGPLDDLSRRVLAIIQAGFPVVERPFAALGERLGVSEEEVLAKVRDLRAGGVIRRLGAVFDSRSLGYASTLVAARVPPERLEEVARAVNVLPGVTHNYRREHACNLWFTLTAEGSQRLAEILEDLRCRTGIADFHSLPALTVYKIGVDLPLGLGHDMPADSAGMAPATPSPSTGEGGMRVPPARPGRPVELTEDQKRLVRLLQEDLPLTVQPFADLAGLLGWPAGRIVEQVNDWLAAGVIRRFGAVLRHRRVGYAANGMAVFAVPGDQIDAAGRALARRREISHCYRRPPLPGFPYGLFAMVHGRSEAGVRTLVAALAGELGLGEFQVLFSTAEYKKTSMRYFTEPPRS